MPFRLCGDEEDYSDAPGWQHVQGHRIPEPDPPEVEILKTLNWARHSHSLSPFKAQIKLHISGSYNPQIKARERDLDYECTLLKGHAQQLYDLIKPIPVESLGTAWFSIQENDGDERKWYISPRLAHVIQEFMEHVIPIQEKEALRRSEYEKNKHSHDWSNSADDNWDKFYMHQRMTRMTNDNLSGICRTLHKRIAALESKLR